MKLVVKPRVIRLDTSSLCQLKCPLCPSTTGDLDRSIVGRGFLKVDDFRELIDKNPWVSEIEIANNGEVFLNPNLLNIFEYAYKNNVILTANSGVNLNSVKKDVLEGLVKFKLRSLSCSIDGASNETYRKYRVNGDFQTVIQNIEIINNFKRKYKSRYPLLLWQFIVFGHNEHEIATARRMAEDLKMEFQLKLSFDTGFSPVKNKRLVRDEMIKSQYIPVRAADRNEYKAITGENYVHGVCLQLWDAPQVNWDGTLLGCCWNFGQDFGGNVFEDGLLVTLNNEKIKYARDMLLGEKPPKSNIPCTTCSLYLEMKKTGKWLKRNLFHRAIRFGYGNIRLPYDVKYMLYRFLRGSWRLPPGQT